MATEKEILQAQIAALFPDNSSGDISALDLRTHLLDALDFARPEVSILVAESTATQTPIAIDTPLQIEFGAAQSADAADLAADGTITIKEAGVYEGRLSIYFTRDTRAGSAFFFVRFLAEGVQVGNPSAVEQSNNDNTQQLVLTETVVVTAGQVPASFTVECVQDGQGTDNGALISLVSTIGWGQTPSARLVLVRLS